MRDTNLNGIIDSIETYNYNSAGEVTIEYDDNADGKVDFIETSGGKIEDVRNNTQKVKDTIKGMFPPGIRKIFTK